MNNLPRTPSGVAMDLINAQRTLTFNEEAFLQSYFRITNRTTRSARTAYRLWGENSQAALASTWLSIRQEESDLKRALEAFDNAANISAGEPDVSRRLVVL